MVMIDEQSDTKYKFVQSSKHYMLYDLSEDTVAEVPKMRWFVYMRKITQKKIHFKNSHWPSLKVKKNNCLFALTRSV